MQPMGRSPSGHLCSSQGRDWLGAGVRGGSRCQPVTAKLPGPDDFRMFSHPAAKDRAKGGFFLSLLRRERIPHRSSFEPRPAKELLHTLFNTPISPMFTVAISSPSFDTPSSAGLLFSKRTIASTPLVSCILFNFNTL